jgi:hypothetical protein
MTLAYRKGAMNEADPLSHRGTNFELEATVPRLTMSQFHPDNHAFILPLYTVTFFLDLRFQFPFFLFKFCSFISCLSHNCVMGIPRVFP